jgi:NAD(P)-dependent dehydrogenase (short-subunit alcohol dehydrogenase family)
MGRRLESKMAEDLDVFRLFSLAGKTAIVTGASRGIGYALANGLAAAGATVVAIARSPQSKVPFRNTVHYISADVSGAIDAVFAHIAATYGAIDVLVNAAGITLPSASEKDAMLANFEQTLKVNLSSPFACCVAARPHMPPGSSIINITSIGSVLGFPGNPGYVAAKGGLRMMTKALAVDYGTSGIRVNALAPGYIHTDMTAQSFANPEQNERRRKHTCLDRWGTADDLVGAAIFLASNASSYVTGQDLFVDGGWTAKGLV